jgi:hypothetical protein
MATHTWKFYLKLGRSYSGKPISGASIVGYTSKTGSTASASLTTNSSGYATHQISGQIINPSGIFWRVNLGNTYGSYYNGQKIVGSGSTSGYYGTPGNTWNTEGVAVMSSNFSSMNPNGSYSVTVYLYVVGQNVSIDKDKYLTYFDVEALSPPGCNYLTSSSSQSLFNKCITGTEIISYYESDGAFKNAQLFNNNDLVTRYQIQEYTTFISGTSATPTLSTTSLVFAYAHSTETTKTVTVTVPSGFAVGYSITGTSSSYFRASISQTDTKTFHLTVYPTNTNYTTSTRVATLVVSVSKIDSDAWFGGSMASATVAIAQGAYQSGGSSGSTGGGAGGGGSQT